MENNRLHDDVENDFNLKEIVDKYLIHWKWFLLGVFLAFVFAFFYLRYATPKYQVTTSILVKDEKKGGMMSELSAFTDLGIGGGVNNVDNEIEILKSRTLIESTIRNLDLTTHFLVNGKVKTVEIFNEAPIKLFFIKKNPKFNESIIQLSFNFISDTDFEVENIGENVKINKVIQGIGRFKFNKPILTTYGTLVVRKTKFYDVFMKKDDKNIQIRINPLDVEVDNLKSKLNVTPLSKTSSVVEISIVDPISEKAEVFLDNLIQTYNEDAAADKNFISQNTSDFIVNRLKLITQELDGVEKDVEKFKSSNNLTDIESEANLFITGTTEYNKESVEVEIQLNVIASMLDFIRKSDNSDLLPTNLISSERDASALIASYNQLVLDRNRLLKSATVENPFVVKLDEQINSLKINIIEGLKRIQSSLNIQKNNLKKQEEKLESKIGKIPSQERQFRVIARQQKVKEELYLYLLQKREETAISLAATEPNARVIDKARAGIIPVSPKKSIIYLGAFILGLLIPFGIIYLMDLLDTKIKSRLDIEGKTQIPFIGDVPTSDTPNEIMKSDSRTSSAEALRIIRTNLEFMVSKVPEGIAKTIFLTSTFPKEGKTFVSVNLAATFALSGKRVLLIGMDIRNPRLDDYLNLPDRGFTNYLSSNDLSLDSLIVKQSGYEDFYVLPAGVIPPNPAELLMSKKVDSFFENIKKQYDYIIVDTAPVSLVTDTLLIAKHADTFIYVARANFLEKRMLNIPITLYKENKLPNMCILLNDTDSTKGYGYGYGYGVKTEKKPWYKRKFNN